MIEVVITVALYLGMAVAAISAAATPYDNPHRFGVLWLMLVALVISLLGWIGWVTRS